MTIWGKLLGGGVGLALGGPLGALLGAVAGHAVDKMSESIRETEAGGEGTKRIAFTIGVIVLGAKMAKADGRVTEDEVRAFREVFHIPQEELKNVGRLFNQARRDVRGFEPYAKQIAKMFRGNPAVLEELIDGLFHIARADGRVADEELDYLHKVSQIFGLDARAWERVRAANVGAVSDSPYSVLGVSPDAGDQEVRTAYRNLVRENHPDRLTAQGMPQEFIDLANEKLAKINVAYDKIAKDRGLT